VALWVVSDSQVPNDAEQSQKKDMRDYGKRTQKKPGTDPKQVAFNLMLTLVIVFCSLPFYIVENAWFRFLIFFLDATFSIPFLFSFIFSLLRRTWLTRPTLNRI
jgi:hypothetical protein